MPVRPCILPSAATPVVPLRPHCSVSSLQVRAVGSPPAFDGPSIADPPLQPPGGITNGCVCHSAVDDDIGLSLLSMQAPRIRAPPASAVGFGRSIAGTLLQPGLDLTTAPVCYPAADADFGFGLQCSLGPRIPPPPATPVGSPTALAAPSIAGMPARPGMGSGAAAAAAVPDSAAAAMAAVAAVADGGIGRTVHRR